MNFRATVPAAVVLLAAAALTFGSPPAHATASGDRDAHLLAAARDGEIVKTGKEIYAGLCKACHGEENATVDSPSNLFDSKWHHGDKPAQIEAVVARGLLEKGMPAWGEVLPAEDVTAVVAYLLSLQPAPVRSAE